MSPVDEYKLLLSLCHWLEDGHRLEKAADALYERLDDLWFNFDKATKDSLRGTCGYNLHVFTDDELKMERQQYRAHGWAQARIDLLGTV